MKKARGKAETDTEDERLEKAEDEGWSHPKERFNVLLKKRRC